MRLRHARQLPYSLNKIFLVRVILLYLIHFFFDSRRDRIQIASRSFLHSWWVEGCFFASYIPVVCYRWGVDDTGYDIIWYDLGCWTFERGCGGLVEITQVDLDFALSFVRVVYHHFVYKSWSSLS